MVANFAGTPFADKAALVVEACAKHGRHYVDITGEISYEFYNVLHAMLTSQATYAAL